MFKGIVLHVWTDVPLLEDFITDLKIHKEEQFKWTRK